MRIDTNERIDVTIHRLNGQIVPIRIPEHRERSFKGILGIIRAQLKMEGIYGTFQAGVRQPGGYYKTAAIRVNRER